MTAPKKRGRPLTSEPATSHLHIRVTPRRKAGYVKAAQRDGKTLAEWALDALDKAEGQ